MTVPVLIHRFFTKHNSAWAYHPLLQSLYPVLRDTLRGEALGDPGPVGPVSVPGGRLVLVGQRSTDPDRPTDEFDREVVVLRVAVLSADQAGDAEQTRGRLQTIRLPEAPGAAEWLGLEGDGPPPADLSPLPARSEAPQARDEKVASPRSYLVAGATFLFLGVLALVLGGVYYFNDHTPKDEPPAKPDTGQKTVTATPTPKVDLVALEGKLREFDFGWDGLVAQLQGRDPDYRPLLKESPQVVADMLVAAVKLWASQLPAGDDAEEPLEAARSTLVRLRQAWRSAGAEEQYLEPISAAIEEVTLRVRYEAVRLAVKALADELGSPTRLRKDLIERVGRLSEKLEEALSRAESCKATGGVETNLGKARAWKHLLGDEKGWDFQVATPSSRWSVTRVWMKFKLSTSSHRKPLTPSKEARRFQLRPGLPLSCTDVEFEVNVTDPDDHGRTLRSIPWRIGGPAAKKAIRNLDGVEIGAITIDCPELRAPVLPDFDEAMKSPQNPMTNRGPSP